MTDNSWPPARDGSAKSLAFWIYEDNHGEGSDLQGAIAKAITEAREAGRFEAYDKAREIVRFSATAVSVIEAQMQEEFPDRSFVPDAQQRSGSRMDGSNMRMPKTPNQFREEGRVEMREKYSVVVKEIENRLTSIEQHDREAEGFILGAASACDEMQEFLALPTSEPKLSSE